jgi:hypothetical protein
MIRRLDEMNQEKEEWRNERRELYMSISSDFLLLIPFVCTPTSLAHVVLSLNLYI